MATKISGCLEAGIDKRCNGIYRWILSLYRLRFSEFLADIVRFTN